MDEDPTQVEHRPPASAGFLGVGFLAVAIPFLATVASLLFGIAIGAAIGWFAKPSTQPIEYLKTASLAELQLVCEPVVQEQKTQLAKVKDQIVVLEATVAEKEIEIAELKEKAAKQGKKARASDGRDYTGELASAKEQLAEAKLKVQMLEQVRDQLVEQLTKAQERLSVVEADLAGQVAITEVLRDENGRLKDDVIVQKWFRFVTESQLDVCERGGKKKTDDCRASVVNEIAKIKREFVHCIRSGQATPRAEQLDKDQALPHFAHMMNQDDNHLAGWYLQLCDPTLPEREIATAPTPTVPAPLPDLDAPDGG